MASERCSECGLPQPRPSYEPRDTVPIDVGPPGAERSVRAPWCLACGREPQAYHVCAAHEGTVWGAHHPHRVWHGLCATCEGESTLECMALLLERMARDQERKLRLKPGGATTLRAEAESLREADRG